MTPRWTLPTLAPDRIVNLADKLGVSETFAALLLARGIDTAARIRAYLQPAWSADPDARVFKNGEAAIARLVQAVHNRERVLIHGDYDVDGTCGAVIYHRGLTRLGVPAKAFLPSRFKDGYGVSARAVQQALEAGFTLLLTADTGSQAYEAISLARQGDMDVIVTDHHQLGVTPVATQYFINPQQPDCPYPYKGLSGGGIALKMMLALGEALGQPFDPDEFIPYATLSTIADVCPLTEENRALVQRGLTLLNTTRIPGLAALVVGLKRDNARAPLTARDCSHGIIPKLNAIGRLASPKLAADLLLAEDGRTALALADELDTRNTERKQIQQQVTGQALKQAEHWLAAHPDSRSLVLASPQWHFGVVGIVAARLVETFGLPSIVLTQHQAQMQRGANAGPYAYTGSGRAQAGTPLLEAVGDCRTLLSHFGGHEVALGIALEAEHLEAFRVALDAALAVRTPSELPARTLDGALDPEHITAQLLQELATLEPTGAGNPTPLFAIGPLMCVEVKALGDGSHRALTLVDEHDREFRGVHFSCPAEPPPVEEMLTVIGTPVASTWNGRTRLEIQVTDLVPFEE